MRYQTVKRQDVDMISVNSQVPGLGEARTYCVRGASLDIDSECCSSNMNDANPRQEYENEAVTGMTNKLMQKRKNNEPRGHNDKLAKPWEEPLLAAHDQAKLDLIVNEDAKIEAGRLAEEERWNCQRQQLQKILRFSKNSITVFRSQKIKHAGYPFAREAKVMNPNAKLFSGCRTFPSGPPDSVIASMRNASEKSISGSNIPFAKVDSTNRDVPAWTREEYLRKNGKIPDRWNDTKDEEFGGALGNNYVNNYVVAGMAGGFDSDSDSDSD